MSLLWPWCFNREQEMAGEVEDQRCLCRSPGALPLCAVHDLSRLLSVPLCVKVALQAID